MLEGVIPVETFPLVECHYGELAHVPSLFMLKMQICVTRPQCVNNCFYIFQLGIMKFLDFENVSIRAKTNIDLNNIVGKGIWYDSFKIQNTKWLGLVNNVFATTSSDNVLCGSFGVYRVL